jgi:hypothetical protein
MRGGCARRIVPSTARAMRLVLGEVARNGLPWCDRPIGGAPGCGGQCVGRSQVAVALNAVAGCDHLTVPVSSASRRGRWADGLEAAPRDLGRRGGVAMDRHTR